MKPKFPFVAAFLTFFVLIVFNASLLQKSMTRIFIEKGPGTGQVDISTPQRIALVVMTKDDQSLLSRYIAYHGHVFGFQNIYVFDGSTGSQKEYLESIAALYPIHVRHSLVDLNGIKKELFDWITEIKGCYDWIFKVDTDEFLVSVDRDGGGPSLPTHPALLLPSASMTKTSFQTLNVDKLYLPAPVEAGPPTDSERVKISPAGGFKQFYNGHSFSESSHFNLGSHVTNEKASIAEGIGIVHYARSYDDNVAVATDVIIGHGYVAATDSKEEMISKLTALDQRPECGQNSCHKVGIVLDDLKNHDELKRAHYSQYKDWPDGGLLDFKKYLGEIFEMYPSIVQS